MKKLLAALLVVALSLTVAGPALAGDGGPHHHFCQEVNGDGKANGADFAAHIVHHARAGMLDGQHNPGRHHQGYSPCVANR